MAIRINLPQNASIFVGNGLRSPATMEVLSIMQFAGLAIHKKKSKSLLLTTPESSFSVSVCPFTRSSGRVRAPTLNPLPCRAGSDHQLLGAGGPSAAAVPAALLSNLMNNLPSGLIRGDAHATGILRNAFLIGVYLGPNLSVTGSLATILWLIAIRREGQGRCCMRPGNVTDWFPATRSDWASGRQETDSAQTDPCLPLQFHPKPVTMRSIGISFFSRSISWSGILAMDLLFVSQTGVFSKPIKFHM